MATERQEGRQDPFAQELKDKFQAKYSSVGIESITFHGDVVGALADTSTVDRLAMNIETALNYERFLRKWIEKTKGFHEEDLNRIGKLLKQARGDRSHSFDEKILARMKDSDRDLVELKGALDEMEGLRSPYQLTLDHDGTNFVYDLGNDASIEGQLRKKSS